MEAKKFLDMAERNAEIVRLHEEEGVSFRELAVRFGVSAARIDQIIQMARGRIYPSRVGRNRGGKAKKGVRTVSARNSKPVEPLPVPLPRKPQKHAPAHGKAKASSRRQR
jgi:YesN/AraC family two-component response regulator